MLFAPKNSILILEDCLNEEESDSFEAHLIEAKKYYRPVLLSELVDKHKRGKANGLFAVCLKHARKNFQLQVLPVLQKLGIPATLFIQPERVGTNRLPLHEEIHWLKSEYSDAVTEAEFKKWGELIWQDAARAEDEFIVLRKQIGALPIQKIGPELYYLKWGDLLDLDPAQFDFGIHLSSLSEKWIIDSKRLAEKQLNKPVISAFCSREDIFRGEFLSQIGLEALVTERVGAITRENNRFSLPHWRF